jgi:hypothetical protein
MTKKKAPSKAADLADRVCCLEDQLQQVVTRLSLVEQNLSPMREAKPVEPPSTDGAVDA